MDVITMVYIVGGGDRTRTCTSLRANGFLDRGSTNYAYSSISRNVPGWVLSRPRFPTQAYDLFFGVFLILYYTLLINLYFVYFGVTGGTRIHDNQSHNLVFYQLNYGHMADAAGFEPADPL